MRQSFRTRLSIFALTAALGAAFAAPAFAQAPAPGAGVPAEGHGHRGRHGRHGGGPFSPEHMEHRLERMTAELSLDAHQVELVREILTNAHTEAEAIHGMPRGEERHAAREALMTRIAERIDAVLDETQRATFAAMRERFAARRGAHRGRHGRGGHGGCGDRAPAAPEGI